MLLSITFKVLITSLLHLSKSHNFNKCDFQCILWYICIILIQAFVMSLMLQVPVKWPKSRDEVWKANIPHTHLAHEKSDQNWMVEKGEKIAFPGGGTHFHYGADKYIASMANVSLHLVLLVLPMRMFSDRSSMG